MDAMDSDDIEYNRCGAGFWSSVMLQHVDDDFRGEGLIGTDMSVNRTWHPDIRYRISQALTLIKTYCPQGKSIIEQLGCVCILTHKHYGSSLSKNVLYQRIDLIELPLPYEDATFDYIFIRSMMDTLPDSMWDDVLKELVRIMKKGAYIECVEAYDNLFDAGPNMNTLNQCKY